MKASMAASILAFAAAAIASPSYQAPASFSSLNKRATISIPSSKGTETFSAPKVVTDTFDGGLKTYGRGVSCTGQAEGGDSDAVFSIADKGTLKNVIIGADQIEGIHCQGSCTLENVWWAAVCEDALTLKKDGDATITGGGATGAADKVIQHNGAGTVTINGFQVADFGKLYRSCGNCKQRSERHVVIKNVKASSGKLLVGINPNFGDTATIDSATCASGVKQICEEFEGVTDGSEPKTVSTGSSGTCKFTAPLASC
ncbi:polysaccharide lyase family 3 protein [Didymella exigua CBS 183.55]|uniref:Pectate lyase n=1 Tax=Didymella exigua CBS 183.55 TaxID=1150837 RepID=A0A6A5RVE2_9PLEO|nr:polysaccharide lyase family 3 protein [Didymella exigua CBS 183.55]KAF1930948.1 polysaccharide lyase family 3 protein [Didymella exigua CBS 183.55]